MFQQKRFFFFLKSSNIGSNKGAGTRFRLFDSGRNSLDPIIEKSSPQTFEQTIRSAHRSSDSEPQRFVPEDEKLRETVDRHQNQSSFRLIVFPLFSSFFLQTSKSFFSSRRSHSADNEQTDVSLDKRLSQSLIVDSDELSLCPTSQDEFSFV